MKSYGSVRRKLRSRHGSKVFFLAETNDFVEPRLFRSDYYCQFQVLEPTWEAGMRIGNEQVMCAYQTVV